MPPEGQGVGIEGVLLFPLTAHPDDRGSFTEVYRRSWMPAEREMVQGNLSHSRAGVLRGLHFHRAQADYWCVVRGSALVGLFDLRSGSPTEGRKAEVPLRSEGRPATLYIPRGVAHGFYAETDLLLYYLVDEYYSGEDEFGIAWDDPGVGIAWPGQDPILSDRDRSNPSLAEARADAPPYP
jgi:dTDP-4-dehydrorhamnose 3,5-epimerase